MAKLKVVHYINQFFAQIGGEEKADYPVELRVGEIVGPGMALTQNFKDDAEIIATIICGDSYFNENLESAKAEILAMVKEQAPDVFIAGPAFNAGRYGVACGTIAAAVQEELGIPSLTGMYVENPGADMFKNQVYMVSTKNSAAGMRDAVKKMAPLAVKLGKGEPIGASAEEGYMPNGVRVNFFEKERGSKRAVDMLLKKLADKPFVTEFPMPDFDRVEPNPAVKDLAHAKIALVTSGGIVPKGNPDHIESSSASHYGEYDIAGVMDLTEETYETAHGGYDPVYANEDSDRVLPVDVLRDMEKEGVIGGVDHVLASGQDINIMVFDTEVYSNTGGQSSKATKTGATAQFAAGGKETKKKDLAGIAMSYGYVYVAQIAMGADFNQTVKAIAEAEAYPGPSLIIAYAPCINHGIKKGMSKAQTEEQLAVECGYWNNFRFNPEAEKKFTLDSKEPKGDYQEFLNGEVRYNALMRANPEKAQRLFAQNEAEAMERYEYLKGLVNLYDGTAKED